MPESAEARAKRLQRLKDWKKRTYTSRAGIEALLAIPTTDQPPKSQDSVMRGMWKRGKPGADAQFPRWRGTSPGRGTHDEVLPVNFDD